MCRAAALKLAAALDHFHLDVTDRICLDVGASTGGFTELLTARGARRVYAIDVGSDQLHSRLRGQSNIVSMEQTDIRALDPSQLAELPDLAAVDVSFISLKLVLPAIGRLLQPRAAHRGADQAAIRGSTVHHQERHRARPGDSSRRVRRHCRVRCLARMARRRSHAVADPGRRRQPRVPDRGEAWLSSL